MSQSVYTLLFLQRSFLSSPTLASPWPLMFTVLCACQEQALALAAGARFLLAPGVKKNRSPVLGRGQRWRARSPGAQAYTSAWWTTGRTASCSGLRSTRRGS